MLVEVQASPVAVPRYQARKAGQEAEWQEAMRYQERDAEGAGAAKRPETDDEYLARLQGCLAFYAAVLQSSVPGNPLGTGQAWQYLSRLVPSKARIASYLNRCWLRQT